MRKAKSAAHPPRVEPRLKTAAPVRDPQVKRDEGSASGIPPSGYTVRLDPDTQARFEELRKGRKTRDIGEQAFRLWIQAEEEAAKSEGSDAGSADDLEESLRENLVSAVTDHLRTNSAWAEAAIKATSLMDPVISVFFRRISHFYSEKQTLSQQFIPWLVSRVLHHIGQGNDVRLVVESGTTLKAALDALGPNLKERSEIGPLRPETVQILTNNFPGAESYETYASAVHMDGRSLSDIVPCELVPGRALQEYAAVVGSKAETYLHDWCTPKRDGRCVRIGLAVGNWVLLEGNPPRPTPLARGAGHKSFKEAVFANCDEIYLISPLCKIIRADRRKSADENLRIFNDDLKSTAPKEVDPKGEYARVDLDDVQPDHSRIKLITTYREKTSSIVKLHSKLIMDGLGVAPKPRYDPDVTRPIREIEHFVYLHDAHSDKSLDVQLKIELPHKRTRVEWFRKKYFDIDIQT